MCSCMRRAQGMASSTEFAREGNGKKNLTNKEDKRHVREQEHSEVCNRGSSWGEV